MVYFPLYARKPSQTVMVGDKKRKVGRNKEGIGAFQTPVGLCTFQTPVGLCTFQTTVGLWSLHFAFNLPNLLGSED